MRLKLRWVLGIPLGVLALDFLLTFIAQKAAGHPLGDTFYWGTAIPWIAKALVYASTVTFFVALILVAPVVLVARAMRKWPALIGPKTRDTPDQLQALERRGPR